MYIFRALKIDRKNVVLVHDGQKKKVIEKRGQRYYIVCIVLLVTTLNNGFRMDNLAIASVGEVSTLKG